MPWRLKLQQKFYGKDPIKNCGMRYVSILSGMVMPRPINIYHHLNVVMVNCIKIAEKKCINRGERLQAQDRRNKILEWRNKGITHIGGRKEGNPKENTIIVKTD
ncbi:hypothetical protein TNCV_1821921 [Trichonephila clavipes]|nr:hypothetical protein TNCV_1821921 [Trichonephila clavipes]